MLMASLLGLLTFTCPAAVILDDFNVGEVILTSPGSISQEALPTQAVASGSRHLEVSRLLGGNGGIPFDARVNPLAGRFEFVSPSFGYFTLTYTFATGTGVDLLADGSTAFRLVFPQVTPGLWRGLYNFIVDGVSHSFSEDLFALNGPGVIDIPFSYFTQESTFIPTTISVSGSRVEPDHTLTIGYIGTIPESGTVSLLSLSWAFFTRRSGAKRQV